MASTYQSPGVYVEEVQRGTRPIESVGTSTAAFIGVTKEASIKKLDANTGERVVVEDRLNKATLVTSWTQFVDVFGDFVPGAYLPDAVYGYFANGGGACYVTSIRAIQDGGVEAKTAEVVVPARNKGSSFTVRSRLAGPSGNDLAVTVKAEGEETFSLSVGKEKKSGLTMKKGENYVGDAQFETVEINSLGSASAVPQEGTYSLTGGGIPSLTAGDFVGDSLERTGLASLEAIDQVRLVLMPDLVASDDGTPASRELIKTVQTAMIAHCEKMRYRFAVLDTPQGLNPQQAIEWRQYVNFDSSFAAMYYPWIKVADFSGLGGTSKLIPPSGHIVGIYNRSDSDRGVHKAPANEVLLGVIDLETHLSKAEQDQLNPLGVNCMRTFPGRGIRVWGARTLSSDGAWRYVSVRRLFIMVEASLDTGMQWVVFEPNDRALWAKVRRDVAAFLKVVWLGGALFGSTPEEAFYVKCDDELNPPQIRDLGQLIIEVGLAPVKPAEFVIFRITQWAGMNAEA